MSWSFPKRPRAGNPWSWRGCYWDHEPQTEVELLNRGFHIAFIMSDPGKPWDAWYTFLTEKHGLSKKPAFIGMSRGGVNEYIVGHGQPRKSLVHLRRQPRAPAGEPSQDQ